MCAQVCQNAIPKATFIFLHLLKFTQQSLFKNEKTICTICIKKMLLWKPLFSCSSPRSVCTCGDSPFTPFRRAPKAGGRGVQTGSRPHVSSQKETWGLLALHFLSILDSAEPRQKHVTLMKLTQWRAEAWTCAVVAIGVGQPTPPEVCFHEVNVFVRSRNAKLRKPSLIPES